MVAVRPATLNISSLFVECGVLIAECNTREQAYHVKEQANFSKESLDAANKLTTQMAQITTGQAQARVPAGRPDQELLGRSGNRATITQSPPLAELSALKKTSARASISLENPSATLADTAKFAHVLSWTKIPAAPRMLPQHKSRLSQQAADAYRAFDKDRNGKLSSVEFFEGMMGSGMGLSKDQVIHLMKIQTPAQNGFVSLQEFEGMFFALQSPDEVVALQQVILEPVDGDDDICVISESPSPDRNHPNPSALTRKNAGVCVVK